MRLAAAFALLLALDGRALARPAPFWERVLDPEGPAVETLVERARLHLDPGGLGGVAPEGAARARTLLDQALARKPRHFRAAVLRAEALSIEGRPAEAAAQLARACPLARTPDDEAGCTSRLALEESRAGRYAEALDRYERLILASGGTSDMYANAAELLMALGRLPEAITRYREALRRERAEGAGPPGEADRAPAYYGLAVALDRDGQDTPSREAMAQAVALDPRLRLLDEKGAGEVFFVPPGDVHYYRGLAFAVLGRGPEAIAALRRFAEALPHSRYAGRAAVHLAALGAPAATAAPAAPVWKVAAAATVKTDGPIPAPMVDAAWKSRPRLVEPCLDGAPATGRATVRVTVELTIDGKGAITKVTVTAPPEWPKVPACIESRVSAGLRLPGPGKPEPTLVRVELVVAHHP